MDDVSAVINRYLKKFVMPWIVDVRWSLCGIKVLYELYKIRFLRYIYPFKWIDCLCLWFGNYKFSRRKYAYYQYKSTK